MGRGYELSGLTGSGKRQQSINLLGKQKKQHQNFPATHAQFTKLVPTPGQRTFPRSLPELIPAQSRRPRAHPEVCGAGVFQLPERFCSGQPPGRGATHRLKPEHPAAKLPRTACAELAGHWRFPSGRMHPSHPTFLLKPAREHWEDTRDPIAKKIQAGS